MLSRKFTKLQHQFGGRTRSVSSQATDLTFPSTLSELFLSNNYLTSLLPLKFAGGLHILDLSDNQLRSLAKLSQQISGSNFIITNLCISNNPFMDQTSSDLTTNLCSPAELKHLSQFSQSISASFYECSTGRRQKRKISPARNVNIDLIKKTIYN